MRDVTRVMRQVESGDPKAADELLPLVYHELRRLAARELRQESSAQTLQPTALVHEAYLRLVDQPNEQRWTHRGHFFAAAAESMRRILVDNARRKRAVKRGGGQTRVRVDADELAATHQDPDVLALDDALTRLGDQQPEIARLVSLRYFAGLTVDQAALAMGISPRTAARNWSYAKAWLLEALEKSD